jgi:lipopolysaccharide heptosyltransferase I
MRAVPASSPAPATPPATAPASTTLPPGARVLVIRLSALGDVLFALETVAALKRARPDVRVDFLVEDRFASLLEQHPQLERVHTVPRRRRLAVVPALLRLRRERYDIVLDLHGILKSALQVVFSRARRKLGFTSGGAREGAWHAYHEAVPLPVPLPHRADRGFHLLAALGLPAEPCPPQLAAAEPPAELLHGVPRPLVLLHPGTSAFAAFKRWPIERFTELAARLRRRGHGVAVSFGPGEDDLAAAIASGADGVRCVAGKELGLRGLAGVLRCADVVVAADTGPLHLAGAVGTACVALFGPKDVARYGPRHHGRVPPKVLFHDVPCRPCTRRDCVSPQCVLGLQVDAVEAAVLHQLERLR